MRAPKPRSLAPLLALALLPCAADRLRAQYCDEAELVAGVVRRISAQSQRGERRRVTIKDCGGSSRENEILDAHEEAKDISKKAYDYVYDNWSSLDSDTYYTRWFGSYSWDRAYDVYLTYSNTKYHLRYTDWTFKCKNSCTKYAYVSLATMAGIKNTISLCQKFWTNSGASGKDSKPGVMIHEVTHIWRIGSTGDKAYHACNCIDLASSEPDKAVDNADSYEYFAEDLAYGIYSGLSCASSSGSGTGSGSGGGTGESSSCEEKYGSEAWYKCGGSSGLVTGGSAGGEYVHRPASYMLNEEYVFEVDVRYGDWIWE